MLNEHAIKHQNIGDVFEYGKLDRNFHAPLVNELTRFCAEAGVNPRDVSGADYHLTDFEKTYLLSFKTAASEGRAGLLYVGQMDPSVSSRMKSTCGALLRNYVPVRMMYRDELVHELWDLKRTPRFDFIAVPDLAVSGLPDAPKRAVSAWLLRRLSRGQQTAIGVSNKKVLEDLFGGDASLITKHFKALSGVIQPS